MTDEEMIEWAIKGLNARIRAEKHEILIGEGDPEQLENIQHKLMIANRRLQRARSFTNPLGLEN